MTETTTNLSLCEALVKAQAEFPKIEKRRTAKIGTYSYKYADLTDIMDAIRPALTRYGLFVTQGVNEGQLYSKVLSKSGAVLENAIPLTQARGEGPQAMGSALTYARRYGLCALLGIVADEDDDAAVATQKPKNPNPPPQAFKSPPLQSSEKPKVTPRPSQADHPRAALGWENDPATEAQRKRLWALAKEAGYDEEHLKDAVYSSFGKESTKDLTKGEIQKLFHELEGDLAKFKGNGK